MASCTCLWLLRLGFRREKRKAAVRLPYGGVMQCDMSERMWDTETSSESSCVSDAVRP